MQRISPHSWQNCCFRCILLAASLGPDVVGSDVLFRHDLSAGGNDNAPSEAAERRSWSISVDGLMYSVDSLAFLED